MRLVINKEHFMEQRLKNEIIKDGKKNFNFKLEENDSNPSHKILYGYEKKNK